jgi:molybdopterin converting factor subunit 1
VFHRAEFLPDNGRASAESIRPTWSRPTIRITVLLFAQARDRAGCSSFLLELPEGSRVSDAAAVIRREHPELEALWSHLAIAVNGTLASEQTVLREGVEVALLPPVSGGSPWRD